MGFRALLGHDARRELVGRLVDEVAREVLRVSDDATFGKTFVPRGAFRVRVAAIWTDSMFLSFFLSVFVFVRFKDWRPGRLRR